MARGKLDTIALAKTESEKEIIRALWRELYGLYNEKYNANETWIRNEFAEEVEFGQALGQANQINGEDSKAIGTGAITRAFREIMMGSYGLDVAALSATEWNPLDLLLVLMNGAGPDNRSNAIEAYKSGLVKIFNALKLSAYNHGAVPPEDGMIQYVANNGLFLHHLGEWISIIGKSAFQIAVDNGYPGTVVEWLASLIGADGAQGIPGEQGLPGPAGADGAQGIQGATGPGLAAGGTTGQKAVKKSNADYDTEWVDDTATAAARVLMIKVMSDNATVTDGNGKMKFPIPQELNGLKITKAEAAVTTASSAGVISVGVYNYTAAKEILSTGITIDVGEFTSYTATVPSVVNAANNTIATGDLIGIDVDAAGINARGLTIILTF